MEGSYDAERPWFETGIEQVREGVFRIPLPLPDEGLRAVNVYVLLDANGSYLIDAGQATDSAWTVLERGLRSLGSSPSDIEQVLVTHIHHDHYSQAMTLRRRHNVPVALGNGEKKSLDYLRQPQNHRIGGQLRLLLRSGARALAHELRDLQPGVPVELWEDPDAWLADWAEIQAPSRVLRAIPTPGHTHGHLVFHDAASSLMFAGDHILPTITPSIGFEPHLVSRPLADYLQSLRLVRQLADSTLLPAHGHVADSTHQRVDELLEHHAERLEDTYVRLASDTASAAEVAERLSWTRKGRALDELTAFNQMLAILETRAHLDVLMDRGRIVRCEDASGVERYQPA